MLTTLLRNLRDRRAPPPLRTAFHECDQCGLRAWGTDRPDHIPSLLAAVQSHHCKPKPGKTL
ncbi:hypothetical protein [Streptomyces sp. NPDC058861]|uniref:hypothetical protein n=1 Tax=Streptomyces sp. NPDC058861 TaxID=3346653 RepID=UPI0036CA23E8